MTNSFFERLAGHDLTPQDWLAKSERMRRNILAAEELYAGRYNPTLDYAEASKPQGRMLWTDLLLLL